MGGWLNAVLLSTLVAAVDIVDIAPRDVSSCPGYVASNVETFGRGLKADLSLAGKACNAYGDDLEEVTLEVTYETSWFPPMSQLSALILTWLNRGSDSCQDSGQGQPGLPSPRVCVRPPGA